MLLTSAAVVELLDGRDFVAGIRFFTGRVGSASCSFKRTFAVPLDARSCSLGLDERVEREGAGAGRFVWRFAARRAFSRDVILCLAYVATYAGHDGLDSAKLS